MLNHHEETTYQHRFKESVDKFQNIFRLTSVASNIIDSNLKIVKVNKALTELLGFSEDEITGTKILDYVCEEYKDHWIHLNNELWNKNRPFFKLEVCLLKKDNTIVWVNVTTILFKEKGITYGFTVLDNITGFKHFEESDKRLNLALKYSKMAAWEMDLKDFSVIPSKSHDSIFENDNSLKLWNRETYLLYILPSDGDLFNEAFEVLAEYRNFNFKGRILTHCQSVKWIHLQGEAEVDEKGNPIRIIGTIKDITQEKLLEQQREDFISIASHELNTPITSLNASLQLINKMVYNPDSKLREVIKKANKSMVKVNSLIDDLLSANNMDNHFMQLNKSVVILSELVNTCCNNITESGTYSIETSGDIHLKVYAVAERIEQVLCSLINNAIKYAPESKVIKVNIEEVNNQAKVSVSDTGTGIEKDELPLLFDRFYRVESNGSQHSGFGLGLYISSEIIKRHGGEMGAESEIGKGSTFWFSIPLA
ncbi:MAG: PAS domain-containing sensor histidine kinase [Flavobacterium sp.]|nr:PAS domain-containing sensor histidine kinase [Pedobacter sp.]